MDQAVRERWQAFSSIAVFSSGDSDTEVKNTSRSLQLISRLELEHSAFLQQILPNTTLFYSIRLVSSRKRPTTGIDPRFSVYNSLPILPHNQELNHTPTQSLLRRPLITPIPLINTLLVGLVLRNSASRRLHSNKRLIAGEKHFTRRRGS